MSARNLRSIPVTTILGYVQGSTKKYEIRRGNDGVMYCSCPHWPIAKNQGTTCKHMKGILGGTLTLLPATTQVTAAPVAPAPQPAPAPRRASTRRSSNRAPLQPGPQPAAVTMTEVERMNRALLSGTMSLTQSGMVTSGDVPAVEDVL